MRRLEIRPYERRDDESVRAICFDTALRGKPMKPYFDDPELVTESLLGYYVESEAESLFVAESDKHIAGYLPGCADTRKYETDFARHVVPRLAVKWLARGHLIRPRAWQLLLSGWKHARRLGAARQPILETHPAHLHLNVARQSHRTGIGSALLDRFVAHLHERDIIGIHVSVESEAGKAFFSKHGFKTAAIYQAPSLFDLPPQEAWIMTRE